MAGLVASLPPHLFGAGPVSGGGLEPGAGLVYCKYFGIDYVRAGRLRARGLELVTVRKRVWEESVLHNRSQQPVSSWNLTGAKRVRGGSCQIPCPTRCAPVRCQVGVPWYMTRAKSVHLVPGRSQAGEASYLSSPMHYPLCTGDPGRNSKGG